MAKLYDEAVNESARINAKELARRYKRILMPIILLAGSAEFFLTTFGIGMKNTSARGSWKVLD